LAWREGAPGQKPPGAIAGGGFTIVNSMTSLTGASGEDFASILRSLGYRLERRVKPLEPVADKPPDSAEPGPIEAGTETVTPADTIASDDEAAAPAEASQEIAAEARGTDAESGVLLTRDVAAAAEDTRAGPEAMAEPAVAGVANETPVVPAVIAEDAAAAPPAPAEAASAPPIAPAEPEMIEVWRPGRAEGRPRPHRKHRDRHFVRRTGAEGATPAPGPDAVAAASAAVAEGAPSQPGAALPQPTDSSEPQRHSRHRRRHDGEQRFDRPRRDRDRDRDRPAANAARHERQDRRPDRREKAPDPNSPFAKLAALKAQLEAEAKERR